MRFHILGIGILAICLAGCVETDENLEPTIFKVGLEQSQLPAVGDKSQATFTSANASETDVKMRCDGFRDSWYHDIFNDYLKDREWCGYKHRDGILRVDPDVVARLDFTEIPPEWRRHSKDLKCILIDLSNGEWGLGYVRSDGRAIIADEPYDNECQILGNGLIVHYVDGFAIFRNENFDVIRTTNYTFADGFTKHLSKVCLIGPFINLELSVDHERRHGGQCGYIDDNFDIVEPIIHPFENTPRPTGGKYDGHDPTGYEAKLVDYLRENIEGGDTIEAVYLQGGCPIESLDTKSYCGIDYSDLPDHLFKEGYGIRQIILRLENQTHFRTHVVYGADYKDELKSLKVLGHVIEAVDAEEWK